MNSLLRERRTWEVASPPDDHLTQQIQTALSCSRAFAVVLARRGGSHWEHLIDPDSRALHPPFSLLGMEEAVVRLIHAIENNERVFIHGDFDVDGLTGAALLYQGLVPLFLPGRLKVAVGDRRHGHGLSVDFVRRATSEGFSLVITVDCGVSNHEEIAALNEAGIDTVVTDHHLPPASLPPACAVIDPKQPGDPYPNKHLAGVGVAYKLLSGLYERLGRPATPFPFLDLVALGTIADLVPLASQGEVENRALVREGFSLMTRGEGSSLGLRVLMNRLKVNPKRITATDVGYLIAPKLNAANRAGDPKVAFLLLTTTQLDRAEYLTETLLDYNRDREIAQRDLIAQAEEQIVSEGIDPREDGILVLVGKYWNEGIIGLAASNLAERYRVPTVVISQGDRTSRASCRSVEGFDLGDCLSAHADLFLQFGGHRMAAGFSIVNENLARLQEALLHYVAQEGSVPSGPAAREIDTEVAAGDLDLRLYTNLHSLSPYGPGNPHPLFLLRDCTFDGLSLVGARRQHVKGKVLQDGHTLPFIAFRMGPHLQLFEQGGGQSLVFRTRFDDWRGTLQAEAVDLVTD
jgi:single-stranded-DNA-specific exonuclease